MRDSTGRTRGIDCEIVALTEFTQEELEEVGVRAFGDLTLGMLTRDKQVIVPIVRTDEGMMIAGEFAVIDLGLADRITLGILRFDKQKEMDWVPGGEA